MDTKKFIASITDCDTGEILGHTFPDFGKLVVFNNCADGEKSCQTWFESFLRGIKLGRNLQLTLTIRDYTPNITSKQLEIF